MGNTTTPNGILENQWIDINTMHENLFKKEIDIKETINCDYLREFVKDESYILKRKLNNTDILHL